jgi:hypothetical protein
MTESCEINYTAFNYILAKLSLSAPSETLRLLALELQVELNTVLSSENSDILVDLFD